MFLIFISCFNYLNLHFYENFDYLVYLSNATYVNIVMKILQISVE